MWVQDLGQHMRQRKPQVCWLLGHRWLRTQLTLLANTELLPLQALTRGLPFTRFCADEETQALEG